MNIKPGTYTLDRSNGTLLVRTGRQGLASKVGHDLTLEATNWNATVTVDGDPAKTEVTASIEPRSLEVKEATGGAKPVSDKDRKDIRRNIAEVLGAGRNPAISFTSTSVQATDDASVTLVGDLSVAGQTRPVTLNLGLQADGDSVRLTGRVPVVQSSFGIKPFSAMMGALKVKDEVEVSLDARLPSA